MNYCEDCILLDLCGLEGSCDDALTFCAYKSEFISRSVIEDIRAEIEEIRLDVHAELFKQGYSSFYLSGAHGALVRVLKIIDKHISGKDGDEA